MNCQFLKEERGEVKDSIFFFFAENNFVVTIQCLELSKIIENRISCVLTSSLGLELI